MRAAAGQAGLVGAVSDLLDADGYPLTDHQ
jgi:hypothetical protein